MRRIFSFLMLLGTVGVAAEVVTYDNNWAQKPLFTLVSEAPAGVEIVFSMHELVVDEMELDGVLMKTFGVPGVFIPEQGVPNLTGLSRYVAIPQEAQVRVTILDARTEVYQNIEVAPAPNIPRENDDRPLRYEKDMSIYGRDAYYPSSPVRLSQTMQMRGVDVVVLGVVPFQYNPVTKELIVYKDIRIKVDFVGGTGHFGEARLRSRFWESILEAHLVNYKSLPQVDFYTTERIQARDGYEYIIIVSDDPPYEAWADTIKQWRKLQGISCEVFTLTEVGGSTSAAIENFLNNAYTTWNPAPVAFLMLGDYPGSADPPGVTSPVWNSHCVSDNVYADVDGDDLPDMHHARICARGVSQLDTIVNKFLSYERYPYTAANFYDNPLVACGWQDDRWFQMCIETARHFFINSLGKNPAREYNIGIGTPTVGCPWTTRSGSRPVIQYWYNASWLPDTINPYNAVWWDNGSAAGVNAAINSGCFIVQHRDHGFEEGWGEPDYDLYDLDGLTNTMFTFVNSTNCLTGKYNNPSEVFAEKFHRIGYGALGLNAASEVSYSFVNDTYIWGMFDYFWPQFDDGYPCFDMTGNSHLMPCLAMTSAKYYLEASWMPDSVNAGSYRDYTYHLFHHHGDAFMNLYSEIPQYLSVNHPPTLLTGATSFTVTANDSAIIALTVNGEIIGVAEGSGDPVAISIPAQSVGDTLVVTVTKANYYRYEVDVPVVVTAYAYVMRSTDIIDDAGGGNGDGVVNPGETIDYGVWAKNVGSATAQAVYGLLSESDPYADILVDSSWYSDIMVGDSALSVPYYSFTVTSNCRHGHEIEFTLDFHDTNDSVFTSYQTLTVVGPLLMYQNHEVVNSNGVLDPGETADLVVTLLNDGGMTAENVTSTLVASSPYITVDDSVSFFGTMTPASSASNAGDPYTVTASGTTPIGDEIEFSIIVEAGIYVDTIDFALMVGQLVPSDTGYYYAYFSGGVHDQSPVFDWIAIDSTQTQYPGVSLDLGDNETAQVSLPFTFTFYGTDYNEISICSNGWIAMGSQTTYDQTNSGIPHPDGPYAMIAALWDDLDPGNTGEPSDIYYYDDAQNHRFIIEYFQVEHWYSGNHETFEIILHDPAYYPTPTGDGEIVIQYLEEMQLLDNTVGIEDSSETVGIQYHYEEMYHPLAVPITDSFALKYTTEEPSVGIEEDGTLSTIPLRTMMSSVYPNPFTRNMKITYQLATGGQVNLKVYDVSGRLVCSLADAIYDPGYYTVVWDGEDDVGRKVAAGVYFIRFAAGPAGATLDCKGVAKTVLLR